MLTIQPYMNYSTGFRAKSSSRSKELTNTSKTLIKDVYNLISSNPRSKADTYRSKRFIDGSFVELQSADYAKKGLSLKYMRMNQRPVEMNINPMGDVTGNNVNSLDVNGIIEKYFPDIIERLQYSAI